MTNKPDSDLAQISPEGDGLTDRQRKILNVIQDAVKDRGFPPTVREIADLVGLASPASVAHQLSALERKGFIVKDLELLHTNNYSKDNLKSYKLPYLKSEIINMLNNGI